VAEHVAQTAVAGVTVEQILLSLAFCCRLTKIHCFLPASAMARIASRIASNPSPNRGGLKWNPVAHLTGIVPDDEIRLWIVSAVALLKLANDKVTVMACRIVVRQIGCAGIL
jgi:hypothetical protein